MPLLTLLLVVPAVGALLLGALVPRQNGTALKIGGTVVAALNLLLSLVLWARFDATEPGLQFQEKVPWIRALSFQVDYHVGVDGISLLLVVLTTFLMVLAFLGSWNVAERVKEYTLTLLLLESGMLGVFLAADLFLFYVFWEAMLLPMYLLIGIWGGPRRIYAAIKFVLFTAVGSLLMLVAIIALAWAYNLQTGETVFDVAKVVQMRLPLATQAWLFAAFALAFAIKVPLFPFHTWLPDAHVEAPTAGSVILAGVLLKMGTYGFLRFCLPLFPDASAQFAPLIVSLAIVGIVYGAMVALAQQDIKKLVAYSSVSHLGFVMLGLFALNLQGLQGSLLQMVNHGISTGALFLLVGMIYERRHTRMIGDYGGLWKQMPLYSALFLVVALSSIALPFTNGFVGEFLILLGAFNARAVWAVLAAVGMVLSAAYMLWMYQRVFFGPLENPENKALSDLDRREVAILVPIVALIFAIGLAPRFFLRPATPALRMVLERLPQTAETDAEDAHHRGLRGPQGILEGADALASSTSPLGQAPARQPGAVSREHAEGSAPPHPPKLVGAWGGRPPRGPADPGTNGARGRLRLALRGGSPLGSSEPSAVGPSTRIPAARREALR